MRHNNTHSTTIISSTELVHERFIPSLRTLSLLSGILVTFVIGALAFEFSCVMLNQPGAEIANIKNVLKAAAAVEDADPATIIYSSAFYPEEVFQIDWRQQIKESDLLHQAALQRGCLKHKNSIISSEFGRTEQTEAQNLVLLINESDPQLFEKLRKCPVADVFVPGGLRSFGYCEDAAAYTKYLKARMLPKWVMERKFQDELRNRTVTYHDLCPKTPMIFFNHYWDKVPDALDWPETKPLYLMPNVEMYELESEHFWRADVILCKTLLCARYLRLWFKQEGNPRETMVLYTRHTTSNLALTFKSQLTASEMEARPEKNFRDVSIIHTAGNSASKGTERVLDCWLSETDLPPLELYISQELFDSMFSSRYAERIGNSTKVVLHAGVVEPVAFGRLIADATYFMCPSEQEGYGHYINQARSSRAFIFTTDVVPMNELITPWSGALIKARTFADSKQFLGGLSNATHALRGVPGFNAQFDGRAVCDTVMETLKNTTPEERAERADRALQQYYFDTIYFAHKMQEVHNFARATSISIGA
ncbi:unnamed protein product [Peronospora belbahrii]|uniref:Glycosyl transferase family 1 domain-containing protein n=1 Tax=Peronospora belbahrii TaxID=622444 RepID=A0AAU9KP96_9STRA|nr:unnamed protein product [Peronospora belbahrii]CAH0513303.1 unnamed protein product [Peronospora belbahrii]